MYSTIKFSDLTVGSLLGVVPNYDFQPVAVAKVVRTTKTMIELSNGQKWRFSPRSGWSKVDGFRSDRGFLTTVEDANERNIALDKRNAHQQRVSFMENVKFKYLPDETLDQLIAVMNTYRQQEADKALEQFLTTGKTY